jgi:hypothetical protein
MARIRTIKPEFWKHEALSSLHAETHMLAAALLNYADDEGYFNANPKLVQAECFPLRELSLSVQGMLSDLSNAGYLRLGKGDDGRAYGHVVNFLDHQRVNHPYPSKIKELEIVWGHSVNVPGTLTEHSALNGKGMEGNKEREGNTKAKRERPSISTTMLGEFELWWSEYPHKVGKRDAMNAFCNAILRGADLNALLSGVRAYKASKPPDRQWCNPATWLNQDRHLDEPAAVTRGETIIETAKRIEREIEEEYSNGSIIDLTARRETVGHSSGFEVRQLPDRQLPGLSAAGGSRHVREDLD